MLGKGIRQTMFGQSKVTVTFVSPRHHTTSSVSLFRALSGSNSPKSNWPAATTAIGIGPRTSTPTARMTSPCSVTRSTGPIRRR